MNFLFTLILSSVTILKPLPVDIRCNSLTDDQMKKAIKALYPEVKEPRIKMVIETINTWAPVYRIEDKCAIIALIKEESTFHHIKGQTGEWGMLQAIPTESHTQQIALRYRCHKEDKFCRCPPDNKCSYRNLKGYHRWVPDIGYVKDGEYKVSAYKLRKFMENNPRAALAIGIGELGFWKRRYEQTYKKTFWESFPKYHIDNMMHKHKLDNLTISYIKGWWKRMKTGLGDQIWIVHHNYGGQLKISPIGRWYPIKFHQFYSKILEVI